jgi:four helix bundle protein
MVESSDKGLDSLKVWQRSMAFAREVCLVVLPRLPADEKWSLQLQLRRSVQSIPANLAEGYGRYYYLDNVRFCYIARGSLEESYSHLRLAHELGYLTKDEVAPYEQEIGELRRMINGYITFLKKSKHGATDSGVGHSIRDEDDLPGYIPDDLIP